MKLIRNTERFEKDGEDVQYKENVILYSNGTDVFQARVPKRYSDDEIDFSELPGVCIPPEHIYPQFDADLFIVAPDPLPADCFVKSPCLLYYIPDAINDLHRVSERVHEEAQISQELIKSPHRNIASYFGCQVKNGRVVALCFKKYKETLFERAERNPEELNKRKCIEDILRGIEHLHSLGYCHNDINPGNVMFDEHDTAIIIDFDSARPVGQELSFKAGTFGFEYDAELSKPENDFHGLKKIEEFFDEKCSGK